MHDEKEMKSSGVGDTTAFRQVEANFTGRVNECQCRYLSMFGHGTSTSTAKYQPSIPSQALSGTPEGRDYTFKHMYIG